MPDVVRKSLVYLDELEYGDKLILMPTARPDVVGLEIEWVVEEYEHDTDNAAYVYLSVFDAMKLREGLDAFISQAVGADV